MRPFASSPTCGKYLNIKRLSVSSSQEESDGQSQPDSLQHLQSVVTTLAGNALSLSVKSGCFQL